MDVPAGPRKSDYLYTNFFAKFPPISIPFSKEKHPIWIKLGAFYNNLPKIHPIYVIWAPSSLMKTPRSVYQISRKGAPKGRHIYVYHVNVRTPPGGHKKRCRNLATVARTHIGESFIIFIVRCCIHCPSFISFMTLICELYRMFYPFQYCRFLSNLSMLSIYCHFLSNQSVLIISAAATLVFKRQVFFAGQFLAHHYHM